MLQGRKLSRRKRGGLRCSHLSSHSGRQRRPQGRFGGLLFTFTGWVAVAINMKTDRLQYVKLPYLRQY